MAQDKDIARIKETVETLAAQRGDAKRPLSAIRRQDIRAIGTASMRSKQLTGAPTMADYNALQADIAIVFNTLKRISNVQGNAVISED